MKVHVVYIGGGVSGDVVGFEGTGEADGADEANGDDDDCHVCEGGEVHRATDEPAQSNFSSEPGFDLLAGKVKGEFPFKTLFELPWRRLSMPGLTDFSWYVHDTQTGKMVIKYPNGL
jgi:hypothetical protein